MMGLYRQLKLLYFDIQLMPPLCPFNNPTFTICLSCNSPFLCHSTICPCHQLHMYCQQFTTFSIFILKIKSFISEISERKTYVSETYTSIIKDLTNQKQELLDAIDLRIQSAQKIKQELEKDFMEINNKEITSIYQLMGISLGQFKLDFLKIWEFIDSLGERAKSFCQSKPKEVTLISKLSNCIDQKPNLVSLKISQNWAKDAPSIAQFSAIKWIGLQVIDSVTIQLLGQCCKSLQGLRVWSYNSVSDHEALIISRHLPNLKQLRLDHQNINDQGAIQIASKLKKLKTLWLDGNNLTQDGKKKIKRLLPFCQNLYL